MPVIESDWPTEIALEVVSPLMYLKTQASALSQLTKGIIEAKVTTTTEEENDVCLHDLSIFASALEDAEVEILGISHAIDLMYPCRVYSSSIGVSGSLQGKENRYIGSFDELRNTVRQVLRSPETTGRISSLIARVNDTTNQKS